MNEVTPELIAQIATRLYNEIPGANQVPKTDSEPSGIARRCACLADRRTAQCGGSLPSLPGFRPRSAAGRARPFAAAAHSPRSGDDGLRAFVQRIRSPRFAVRRAACAAETPDEDPIHAAVHRASSPVAGPVARQRGRSTCRPFATSFPLLHQQVHGKPLAWLDNAATTQKPQSVIDAMSRFYAHDNSNIHRGAHTLAARATDAFEQARQKVQTFLGPSSAKEIVFVRGTTEGINLVAQTYGRKFLQPGDEIVLSTLEHHANIVPWQMVAKEKGAVLRVIPGDRPGRDHARRVSGPARAADAAGRADPGIEQPGHDPAGRRNDADGQALQRPRADRRGPVRGAHAGQRPAARLRLLCLLGPQDFRPHGHRRRLRQGRTAGDHAAVARRRQHDPQRDL